MFGISFGSTYRIPITQPGANNAKKEKLRSLIESYPNGLIGKSKTGQARVSVSQDEDAVFEGKLKAIGYKVFQKFDGHDIPKENLDTFIKQKLDTRDYNQKGKKMKKMPRELREQRRFERRYTPSFVETQTDTMKDDINEFSKSKNEQPELEVKTKQRVTKTQSNNSSVDNQADIERIKNSEGYKNLTEQYGQEFADAVYFGIK